MLVETTSFSNSFQVVESFSDFFPFAVVHAVNTKAVCKSRYSVEIKKSFPFYFKEYQRNTLRGTLQFGSVRWVNLAELFGTQIIYEVCCRESWKTPFSKQLFLCEMTNFFVQLKTKFFEFPLRVGVPAFECWNTLEMANQLLEILDKVEMQNIELYVQSGASNAL